MRVLLVVQHPLLSEALCMVLAGRGHEVAECHSTGGAVRVALEHRPDSVVLDLSLPGAEAETIGRSILTAQPDTVLIGLGATDAPDSMRSAFEFGCSARICTDAPLDQFLDLLEDAVKAPQHGNPARA